MSAAVRGPRAALSVTLVFVLGSFCDGFNLDTDFPIVFNGSRGSYFGYSAALHRNKWGYLALIGAPRANTTTLNVPVFQPGTLFRCNITAKGPPQPCKEITLMTEGAMEINRNYDDGFEDRKTDMWLGVSLDVRPTEKENDIVACGHLWRNQYHYKLHLVNGVCYVINGDLETGSIRKLLPLTQRALQFNKDYTEHNYAHGQVGISAAFSEDGSHLILGAPGIWSWTGSIVDYDKDSSGRNQMYRNPMVPRPANEVNFNSYLGYSVTTGRFFESNVVFIAAGAPKDGLNRGNVYIIRRRGNFMNVRKRKQGTQLGEYFGASVLGVNLNGDLYTDLVVGAPLNSLDSGGDEGLVYVYMSNGKDLLKHSELTGDQKPNARFGTALANIGDLNMDNFTDIAVGAPYEEGKGAVYIYHGSSSGIISQYTQKIHASEVFSALSGFGIHISRGMDVDNNGYPDILVGSYASANAVLLRSKPVVHVIAEITVIPKQFNINETTCHLNGLNVTCVKLEACVQYADKNMRRKLVFAFKASSPDPLKRTVILPAERRKRSILALDVPTACQIYHIYLKPQIKDVLTPVVFEFEHYLVPPDDSNEVFYEDFPVYHPSTTTVLTTQIPFQTGCGEENYCRSDLIVSAFRVDPVEGGLITLGRVQSVSFVITVRNHGEPAYLSELLIFLPPEMPTIKHDFFCDSGIQKDNSSLLCDLGNPLRIGTQVNISVKLDATNIPPHTKYLEVICRADTISSDMHPNDNTETLPLHLKTEADIGIIGTSSDNQIMHDGKQPSSPIITHTYTVRNHGPSPLQNINILLKVPYWLLKSDEKTAFVSFKGLNLDSGTGQSLPVTCEDRFLNITEYFTTSGTRSKTKYNKDGLLRESIEEFEGISNASTAKDLIKPPADLTKRSDVKPPAVLADKESEDKNSSHSKTRSYVSINCERKDVECVAIECSAAPFINLRKFAQISLYFEVAFTVLDEHFSSWYQIEFLTTGSISLTDASAIELDRHPENAQIKTVFLQEGPPPPKEIAPWIIFVSVVAGVLLLLLILILLIKVGFFKRKDKDRMKELLIDTNQGEVNPQEISDVQEIIDEADIQPE